MFQPAAQCGAGGASFLSPAGALAFTQSAMVASCSELKDGSFAKWPQQGSANQGGILRFLTESKISCAQGLVSW